MDITPYKLDDDTFWASSDRGEDRMGRELVGEYRGILVDAPRRVPLDRRATVPAGIYHLGAIRELAAVRVDRFGTLTAMDVTRNRLYAVGGGALVRDTDPLPRRKVDPARLPEGDMGTIHGVELRELLGLPWEPARYLFTVLLRGEVSNRAAVELVAAPGSAAAGGQADENAGSVWPLPGVPLPAYRRQAESPPIPPEPGVLFAPQRLVDLDRQSHWPLYGAFRLAPLAGETVKPGWRDPYYDARPAEPKPVAVVGVTLLVASAEDGTPSTFAVRVPAWSRAAGAVTGYFNLDLFDLPGIPRAPGTYFISAFSGETLAGPLASALVRL